LIQIGEIVEIGVTVNIKEGYHLQANPVNDDFLIPTTLEVQSDKEIITGNPIYPPGESFNLEGSTDTLLVYSDKFYIEFPLKVTKKTQPGEYALKGKLHYQACDSIKCFAPRSMIFTIPIKAVKR
jgi:hypothetical protein